MKYLAIFIFAVALLNPKAHSQGEGPYKAPQLKLEGQNFSGHRMAKDQDWKQHSSRYKVQDSAEPERDVASDAEKKSRDPSSDAVKKPSAKPKMQYWHVAM